MFFPYLLPFVIHQNSLSTLVPDTFFNKDYLASYLSYNIKTLATDFIAFDSVENTTINSVPVIIKTTTKIERKFALAVPINDVYDWGRENSKGHEFIYSKYIRAGNGFDSTNQAPSCENVPGAGDNFPLAPDMRGEVRVLKAGGRGLPTSMQEWENQKN